MAECFNCGAYVPPGGGCRREVYTGESWGNSWSYGRYGRFGGSQRSYYGIRTVCPECASKMNRRAGIAGLIVIGLVLCLIIGAISSQGSGTAAAPLPHVRHGHHRAAADDSTLVIPSRLPPDETP